MVSYQRMSLIDPLLPVANVGFRAVNSVDRSIRLLDGL